LADRKVDAVFIATPVSSHYILARAALEAGKHVFVEKPFASTSSQAGQLLDLADRRNLTLAVGHVFIHHPALTVMKAMVDEGRIGRPCYAESVRVNPGPPASEIDVIWDLAIHDLAILIYLMGSAPIEVQARANQCVHKKLSDVAFIRVQFENGFFSQHHVSWLSPAKVRSFSLYGDAGSLVFDDMASAKLCNVDIGIDTRVNLKDDDGRELSYKPGHVFFPELPNGQPLERECKDFLDAIRGLTVPKADGRAGLAVVNLLECIAESAAAGGKPIRTNMVAGAVI
jgi:predicted dehydrogenase